MGREYAYAGIVFASVVFVTVQLVERGLVGEWFVETISTSQALVLAIMVMWMSLLSIEIHDHIEEV